MILKQYQQDALATLRRFLESARIAGPKAAYEKIASEPDLKSRLGAYGGSYTALNNLPGVPYVCLRLPTGGGKTILGAHAIKEARDAWIEKDYPLVLWLVTSNIIRTQTVEAFKNTRHPYRQVLDEAFEGRVRVFDIADFETIRPHDIASSLCLVIGTIQTLRVTNTEGRKVYAHHEALEPHFTGIPPHAAGLERIDGGKAGAGTIKFSFANLLHLHRPLMIVDEAHNAVTGLSREVQERVNPCAVIEFTATPRFKSNTLYNVKAQELKAAEMIKLPIILSENSTWQGAVSGAIQERAALEEEAKGEREYLRPITLYQAEAEGQETTVEALRKHLVEVENVPENHIVVATGDQRGLDNVDLFDRACVVRHVITKQALKEGWDCSFAYVFCSLANVASATDVEQLLGRVMRMPYAQKRKSEKLNRAYAHVPETRFGASALALKDKLVTGMGFEEGEAEDNIQPAQQDLIGEGFFGRTIKPKPRLAFVAKATAALEAAADELKAEGITVSRGADGAVRIMAERPVTQAAQRILAKTLDADERSGFGEATKRFEIECRKEMSPAELGMTFVAPRFVVREQGELVFLDNDTLMEFYDWSLLNTPARLEASEFDARETATSFEIDLDGERVTYGLTGEQHLLPMDVPVEGWTPQHLAIWLDKEAHDPHVGQSQMLRWTTGLVTYLSETRGIAIPLLERLKFILARKVRDKIAASKATARQRAHQLLLFGPEARAELAFESGFKFFENMFWDRAKYRGAYRFAKHFHGPDDVVAFDGKPDGEEFQCAQALDSIGHVKHWVRNAAQHENAFSMPLAQQNFYPDFVAELNDGRILIVEYKGELTAASAQERRTVGEAWERLSKGKGLFFIVEKSIDGLNMRAQLERKLGVK